MDHSHAARILTAHVPPASYLYCFQLWKKYQFDFRLRKTRLTKVGDFTFRNGHVPRITVNQDLDPYLFLITYIHEVAHLDVHRSFGNRVEAHGREWKSAFRELMQPVMTTEVFPEPVLAGLHRHMRDPRASTFSDLQFTELLRRYDEKQKHVILLSQLPEGAIFGMRGKWFKKGKLRRTRVECKELKTKASYLVPVDATIEHAQLSLL